MASVLRQAGCVFAEDEARLLLEAAHSAGHLEDLLARRTSGEPLELVLGWADFCGRRVLTAAGVFVPRRRTELLVEATVRAVLSRVRHSSSEPLVLVDLCCGTGAVGASVVSALDRPGGSYGTVDLHAVDLDPAAARCARRNVPPRARVHVGDLYEGLPPSLRGRVDVVVVNPPYVPTAAIAHLPPEARLHEPRGCAGRRS